MRFDPRTTFLVAVGGVAGAGLRWAVVEATMSGGRFPWWTLLVNVAGCLVLGMLVTAGHPQRVLVGTGVCGGLTTFSTFAVEVAVLVDAGDVGIAGAYLSASAVTGVAAALAGRRVASTW